MVKNDVFSMVGGLGGYFYQDICEPKLFGVHIGSVLSGLDAGNVNTDSKIFCWVWRRVRVEGSKMTIFSIFGDLGGDFCKETYEPKLFGMHIGSVLRGWNAKICKYRP